MRQSRKGRAEQGEAGRTGRERWGFQGVEGVEWSLGSGEMEFMFKLHDLNSAFVPLIQPTSPYRCWGLEPSLGFRVAGQGLELRAFRLGSFGRILVCCAGLHKVLVSL